MRRFLFCFLAALAAHGAWADTVITRVHGTLNDPQNILFGGAQSGAPYELEVRSAFDYADLQISSGGSFASTYQSNMTIALTVGGVTTSYDGHGATMIAVGSSTGSDPLRQFSMRLLYRDIYDHNMLDLWQSFILPPDSFAHDHALQPVDLVYGGAGSQAGLMTAVGQADWGDVYVTRGYANATNDWYSLQILTDVPEPRRAAMLMAGLLVLVPFLRRRLARSR
jgi:hypothetical protein